MEEESCLEVKRRTETGKGVCRKIRSEGLIPGVVYGLGNEPTPVAVELDALRRYLRAHGGQGALINMSIDGDRQLHALLREIQNHSVTLRPLHVDFYEVDMSVDVQVQVPIQIVGQDECPGLAAGGALDLLAREVSVTCLPSAIPEVIEVDVSSLELGQSALVSGLTPLAGVEFSDPPDTQLVIVSMIRGALLEEEVEEEGEEPEEGEEAAEQADAEDAEPKE